MINLLTRLKIKLLNRFWFKHLRPQMQCGYYCLKLEQKLPNTRISNTTAIIAATNLAISDNVFIGHFNQIDASNGLTIKQGCQITNFVTILTHSSHIAIRLYGGSYIANNGQHIGYVKASTSIGEYSFIGPHSTIMPDVHLGKGTIVHSHSYVKAGNYPDFAIIAGNPAIIVGDSRDIDNKYLVKHPELIVTYMKD